MKSNPEPFRTEILSVERSIVQHWTVVTRLKFRMHVASVVLQIPRKKIKPRGSFWTEMKAGDESRDETDWEGYEIKEGAMIWAKVNPRKKVGGDSVRKVQRKPTIFSRALLHDSDDHYSNASLTVTWLAYAVPSCLSDSTQHSPLSRHSPHRYLAAPTQTQEINQ